MRTSSLSQQRLGREWAAATQYISCSCGNRDLCCTQYMESKWTLKRMWHSSFNRATLADQQKFSTPWEIIKVPERGEGREALVGKGASCSSKGPGVCSQHPCQQRLKVALSTCTHVVCTYMYTNMNWKGRKPTLTETQAGSGRVLLWEQGRLQAQRLQWPTNARGEGQHFFLWLLSLRRGWSQREPVSERGGQCPPKS